MDSLRSMVGGRKTDKEWRRAKGVLREEAIRKTHGRKSYTGIYIRRRTAVDGLTEVLCGSPVEGTRDKRLIVDIDGQILWVSCVGLKVSHNARGRSIDSVDWSHFVCGGVNGGVSPTWRVNLVCRMTTLQVKWKLKKRWISVFTHVDLNTLVLSWGCVDWNCMVIQPLSRRTEIKMIDR